MPTRPISTLLACFALLAGADALAARPPKPVFAFADVDARAKALADEAYKDPGTNLPGALQHLDHEHYSSIRFRPEASYWRSARLPFELAFFHEGWLFDRPVKLEEIGKRGASEIKFDPGKFRYPDSGVTPDAARGLGYAGFSVHYALNMPAYKDDVLAFLGASYFRAVGRGQTYGLSARGLAIDTALASGEEFPRFVEFWFERPKAKDDALTFYALLDSPRATGAYRFMFAPGDDSVVEVTARIYLRDKVGTLGIAPLTSMFFHGSDERATNEDYRPEVHDSDGLSIQSKTGEWIWRPLVNPKRLLVTSFTLDSPQGFGLMQRERSFSEYQDLSTHYELHPSAWIEPVGEWGHGRVELVEIPAPDETNDNIVAFWVSDHVPAPREPLDLHYRIHWQKDAPTRPPTAWVAKTFRGKGFMPKPDKSIGFVLDYVGPMLVGATNVTADVTADANGQIVGKVVRPNPTTGGWRVELRVRRIDESKPIELRASLHNANEASETWSYVLPPA